MIINLTPHSITETTTGAVYPPSGQVARVAVTMTVTGREVGGAPVSVATYGEIEGLPATAACPVCGAGLDSVLREQDMSYCHVCGHDVPEPATYIVSGMVLAAISGRQDVVAPGDLVRDENGQPVGCRGWKGVA